MFDRSETVGFQVRKLSNLFKRQKELFIHSDGDEFLHGVSAWTIGFLYENSEKDIYQKDIEKEFNIRRPTASAMLKSLENGGYITRISVEKDKRLKKIILTKKSIERNEKMMQNIEETENCVRKGLSDEELSIFFDCVKKMQNNLIDYQERK